MSGKEKLRIPVVVAKNEGQKEALRTISEHKVSIVSGVPGTGKAQPLDCLVYTPDGPVEMGNLKIGDLVCTPSGDIASVISIFPQGMKNVYRINFSDGSTTRCCEEHLWTVYVRDFRNRSNKGKITESLSYISSILKSKDGRNNISIPANKTVNFNRKNLLIDPYLVGLLIGDGALSHGNIVLTTEDEEIISFAITTIDDKYKLKVCSKNIDYKLVRDENNRNTNHYKEILKHYDLLGKKSYEKSVPKDYLFSDEKDRWSLLQGLMDSDGSVSKVTGQAYFCTSSLQLAKDVKLLSDSLGGVATISKKQPIYTSGINKKQGRTAYIVHLRLVDPSKAFRLTRKKSLCKKRSKYLPKRQIESIVYEGPENCQCILIDHKDHLYLTDDLIATHNTHISVGWGLQEMQKGRFEKLILTRPVMEAGENLGFLPGTVEDKIAPYMMPMYDILNQYLSLEQIKKYESEKKLVIMPIAYMRGITFNNAYVVADECQNATIKQMHMILTRLGEKSKIVMTGDVLQSDIRSGPLGRGVVVNGLEDAIKRLEDIQEVGYVELGYEYCVRDPLVNLIDERYRDPSSYPPVRHESRSVDWERFSD